MKSVIVVFAAACGGSEAVPDAQFFDAPRDAPIDMNTTFTATLQATRTLDRGYYGVNTNGSLHVEIYKGGDPGCPTMNSANPNYTLILANVQPTTMTASASFIDFTGDMLPTVQPESASVVTLTNLVYSVGAFLTLDANLTFPHGTVTGHLYATHCTSLDG